MRTVLIGAAGTGTAFAIASRLRANWGNNIRLLATDIKESSYVTTSLLSDRFFVVPSADKPTFKERLVDILVNEAVNIYIPIVNNEFLTAAILMEETQFSHIDFWCSPKYIKFIDKIFAYKRLHEIGIPTPKCFELSEIRHKEGKWLVKPRHGSGSLGVQIMSASEIENFSPEELKDVVIQEVCTGPEVTVDSFFNVNTGESYSYCRERIETKSGVCTKARLFSDRALHSYAIRIGTELNQLGAICFQVMKHNDGEWVVTDLNLRSGAGTAMTCAAGFDVLSAAFACRIGEDYSHFVRPLGAHEFHIITRQYSEFVMSTRL